MISRAVGAGASMGAGAAAQPAMPAITPHANTVRRPVRLRRIGMMRLSSRARVPHRRERARAAEPSAEFFEYSGDHPAGGRLEFAGPLTTQPKASKREPWHGQSHVFSRWF